MPSFTYRSSKTRVSAVVAAIHDGGVEAPQKLEVAASRPWLHDVETIIDAKLTKKTSKTQIELKTASSMRCLYWGITRARHLKIFGS